MSQKYIERYQIRATTIFRAKHGVGAVGRGNRPEKVVEAKLARPVLLYL
jgi:hypothetical protein